MIGIYMFTNTLNGKSYVGQSTNIRKRRINHKSWAKCKRETSYIDSEMSKYGFENFAFRILEECDVEQLDEREQYYIEKYNTVVPHGYNKTKGGRTGSLIALRSRDDVTAIQAMLKDTNLSEIKIAEIFGVSDVNISDINLGHIWKTEGVEYPIRKFQRNHEPPPRYCQYCGSKVSPRTKTGRCWECWNKQKAERIPDKDTLYDMLIADPSFTRVGRKYGVSPEAVRKWCKKYGMSDSVKSYMNKDDKQDNIPE